MFFSIAAALTVILVVGAALPPPVAAEDGRGPVVSRLEATSLEAEVAAIILSGRQGGDLETEATVSRLEDDPERLQLVVEVATDFLFMPLEAADSDADSSSENDSEVDDGIRVLEIYAYVLADNGISVRDSLLRRYRIDIGQLDPQPSGLIFVGSVRAPLAAGSLRLLVRHRATGSTAARVLEIGDPAAARLSAFRVAEERSGWLDLNAGYRLGGGDVLGDIEVSDRVASVEAADSGSQGSATASAAVPRTAAKAIAVRGQDFAGQLLAHGVDRLGSTLEARFIKAGDTAAKAPASVQRESPASDDGRLLDVAIDTTFVPAGVFELRLVIPGAADVAEVVSDPLQVVVVDSAEQAQAGWPGLLERLVEQARNQQIELDESKLKRRERREIETELNAVVDTMVETSIVAASQRYFTFARRVARQYGPAGLNALSDAQTNALDRLSKDQALAAVPMITMGLTLYRNARDERDWLVASYARRQALAMIDRFVATTGSTVAAQKIVAKALIALGRESQLMDMANVNDELFERADLLDPDQHIALLTLGAMSRQVGGLSDAARATETLLKKAPNHREALLRMGRLRLEMNQKRVAHGLFERAVEVPGTAATSPDAWVLSLAVQELAKLELDAGRSAAALEILQKGLERLPGDPRLLLLSAFANDTLGRSTEAQKFLQLAQGTATSPRRRFVEPPTQVLLDVETQLYAEATNILESMRERIRRGAAQ